VFSSLVFCSLFGFISVSSPPQDIYFLNFDCYQTVTVFFEKFWAFLGSVFLFFPVLNPGRIYQDSRCERPQVALKKARPLCAGRRLHPYRCGPRTFLSWERVACHLLGLGKGLESSVFAPVSFYSRAVS